MRCLVCDAEMALMNVRPDESMGVAGFERHTLQCPSCGDVEHRLIFNRERAAREAEQARVSAPPVSPAATSTIEIPAIDETAPDPTQHRTAGSSESEASGSRGEGAEDAGVWARAVARLRGRSTE
jgi:hypothetical protein